MNEVRDGRNGSTDVRKGDPRGGGRRDHIRGEEEAGAARLVDICRALRRMHCERRSDGGREASRDVCIQKKRISRMRLKMGNLSILGSFVDG